MTAFELQIIAAIRELGEDAYGVPLRERLDCSFGALYVALGRLEENGQIVSRSAQGGPERGGRIKRYWRVKE